MYAPPRWPSAIFLFCTLSIVVEAADTHAASNSKTLYIVASAGLNDAFDTLGMSGELDISNGWIGLATLGWQNDARTKIEQVRFCDALEKKRAAKGSRSDHEPCEGE